MDPSWWQVIESKGLDSRRLWSTADNLVTMLEEHPGRYKSVRRTFNNWTDSDAERLEDRRTSRDVGRRFVPQTKGPQTVTAAEYLKRLGGAHG